MLSENQLRLVLQLIDAAWRNGAIRSRQVAEEVEELRRYCSCRLEPEGHDVSDADTPPPQ